MEPKNEKVFLGKKNSMHIIDLIKQLTFKNALVQMHKIIAGGGKYSLFQQKTASEQVSELAKETSQFYRIIDG